MPKENQEIVRRAWEAATRRPKPDSTIVNALYQPDHELISPLSRLEGTTFIGAQGFGAWLTGVGKDWVSWESSFERATDVDEDRVLLTYRFIARSKRGGVPIEQRNALVVTVRGGKVTRTEAYSSLEQALEAVGLSKQEDQADFS
jgi:ketosteroid isomerase-like protein